MACQQAWDHLPKCRWQWLGSGGRCSTGGGAAATKIGGERAVGREWGAGCGCGGFTFNLKKAFPQNE